MLMFQSQVLYTEQFQKYYGSNWVLNQVNCNKKLACFYVQFDDFIFVEAEDWRNNTNNNSQCNSPFLKSAREYIVCQTQKQLLGGLQTCRAKQTIKQKTSKRYFMKSTYTLCIFTYFPFISLMKQIISSLLNEIRTNRKLSYSKNPSFPKNSVTTLILQLKQLSQSIIHQSQHITFNKSQHITLQIGRQKLLFNFEQQKINKLIFNNWVSKIYSLFSPEMMSQIIDYVLIGKSICFVCERLDVLTYVIYFFVNVGMRVFVYPFPVVSRVLCEEFLGSPFVMIAGIQKSSMWVNQNKGKFYEKIFVDLNGTQAKIYNKKTEKPARLTRILSKGNQTKKTQSSIIPQFFRKRSSTTTANSSFQNKSTQLKQKTDQVSQIIKNLDKYFKQQLLDFLPNSQIINTLKQVSPQLSQIEKSNSILKYIQKYVKQERKLIKGRVKCKDNQNFIEEFMEGQIFKQYVCKFYNL